MTAFAMIAASAEKPRLSGSPPPVRLLILDADRSVANALAFLLDGYGYESVVARDVDDAREILDSEAIDVVIADPLFPGGGRRWLAELRAVRPQLPVLVLTADSLDMLGLARVYGLADAVLPKPSESGVLVAVLRRVLGRWHGES
jgi:DNA-binding response OmpR family regulator